MFRTPFIDGFQQQIVVRLDQGMLEGSQDWVGFASQIYEDTLHRFFLVNDSFERIIKPIRRRFSSDEDKIDDK